MNRLMYGLMLLPLLPLLAASWHRLAVVSSAGLAWVLFLGGLFIFSGSPHFTLLLVQIPFLLFVTGIAAYFSRKHSSSGRDDIEEELLGFEVLKARHADLKGAIARGEKEENRSFQIYGVSKALAESLSWTDMAPRLTAGIQKVFGAYDFLLYAIDQSGQWTPLYRRGNWIKEPPLSGAVPPYGGFMHPPQTRELVPIQVVPIYNSGPDERVINGVLFLKIDAKDIVEQELLEAGQEFGEQIGMALNKALLFAQMETHSRVDGLTGVLRRQAFMDRLENELKRAGVFQTPFCVMMLDIDHFKRVNDDHGHAAGDAVLQRLGQILKESFYETDVVGRYGGEEFVALMPHAQLDGVQRKAENLRKRIEQERIACGFESLSVTVSIGLSHFPEHGRSMDELIAAADKAMYQAKATGRNRVVTA